MNLYDACLVQGFNKYKCPMHHVKSWFGSVCRVVIYGMIF